MKFKAYLLFFFFGLMYSSFSTAQENKVIHLDKKGKPTKDEAQSFSYRIVVKDPAQPDLFRYAEFYTGSDLVKTTAWIKNASLPHTAVGEKLTYHVNGQLHTREQYNEKYQLVDTAYRYYANGVTESIKIYKPQKDAKQDVYFVLTQDSLGNKEVIHGNGNLRYRFSADNIEEGPLVNNKKNGEWTGKSKKSSYTEQWENDVLISGVSTDSTGTITTYDKDNYEVSPEYPGGINALRKIVGANYQYPAKAVREGLSGTVILSFLVEKDGSMSTIKIEQDLGSGTGEAAMDALRQVRQKWSPGILRGNKVRVAYRLPITLSLNQ
ncbi:energy transducer TonB [Sphingobacterium psychroaquaticum]|uniref:energy transducer TonB n=1 Tax=Sphingobacterium psychroaquaticum TaxID=561061 RepID=UPI00106D10D8|nr:energy transducer TonB [Sphingobacterium psychroaquaticum]QBQ40136.1 energy transducer TonB [Sphingobacterium psychroaquaticum]